MIVSIVIPVFGAESLLTSCLAALEATQDTSQGNLTEIVCVSNGCDYETPGDVVIRNPENLGYAKACNQGVTASSGEYVLLLNNDVEVQPGWLLPLVQAMSDSTVAMCGPKIIHPAGDIQTTGIRTWHGGGSAGGEELKDDSPSRDVDGVTGACMMVRRSVWDELDGMCELFWCGYDDVDLCLRVREASHRIRYVSESTVVHQESASGPARWVRVHENVALMNQRWGSR